MILLITPKYMRSRLNINLNVDHDILNRAILEAQEVSLMEVIGESLYDKIISDVEAGTLTGDYLKLTNDYIAPYLSYVAFYNALISGSYKFANGNIYKSQSQNGEGLQDQTLKWILSEQKNKSETYKNRLINHLCYNTKKYPEYSEWEGGEVNRHSDSLFGGISLTGYVDERDKEAWKYRE